ncbi:MAG: sulfite exporter TauE/SafE family protein [Pyrinomonadaceae bacterium]
MVILALLSAALAFVLSASAGMGGSLILVPVLGLLLGPKEGIAVSSLLLGGNNIVKVIAYRQTIPWRAVAGVLVLTVIGSAIGAQLLINAPARGVSLVVIITLSATFLTERMQLFSTARRSAPLLAFCAGATSGFSGSAGPLKGIALRNMAFDRRYMVGAASAVSLAGDAVKATIFTQNALLDSTSWLIVLCALPLMPLATLIGRRFVGQMSERTYTILFWMVMAGYLLRLLLA